MSYCLRFIHRWLKREQPAKDNDNEGSRWLTTTELQLGEKVICSMAQRDAFAAELSTLAKTNRGLETSPLKYLNTDGLIRVDGRLGNATLVRARVSSFR